MALQKALENLKQQIGKEATNENWMAITQERINQFADASDDHQWIHTEPEKAKLHSPFETTIAHGYLTLSLIVPLTKKANEETQKFDNLKMAVNYGLNKVRFPAPVKVNSRIRARTKLIAVEHIKNCLQLSREVTIEIENEKKPACVAETISRLYF